MMNDEWWIESWIQALDKRQEDLKQLILAHRKIWVVIRQIVAEVGDVVAAIVLFIDHIGVGDDRQKRKWAVGDVEPVSVF